MDIPERIGQSRIKRCSDGSVKIILPDKEAEGWLDKHYKRIPGYLRWWPEEDTKKFELLQKVVENQSVYIIGKGPSLDKITESDFLPGFPIIAINDAIHKIEMLNLSNPLFMMQQDFSDKTYPKSAIPIVSYKANSYFTKCKIKIVYNPYELGCSASTLTVICAIKLCILLKVQRFIFYCFDSCITQNCDYAECIGYPSDIKHNKKRFLGHRTQILEAVGTIPYEFKLVGHV